MKRFFNSSQAGLCFAWGVVVLALLIPASVCQTAFAQTERWNTEFLADDTFAVVAINVARLLNYEKPDSEVRVQFSELLEENMGINLNQLREVQFVLGGDVKDGEEESNLFQVKFLFSEPQKMDSLVEAMFEYATFTDAEHHGNKYFRADSAAKPSVFAASPQTMIVANEPRLKQIMDNQQSMGEFVEWLKQADGESDLFIAFKRTAQVDKFLEQAKEEARGLPIDIKSIGAEATHGTLAIKLGSNTPVQVQITAKDQEGAERLDLAIKALLSLGKIGINKLHKNLETPPDFGDDALREQMLEQQKLAAKALMKGVKMIDGTQTSVDGYVLSIMTQVEGGFVEEARFLLNGMLLPMHVELDAAPPVETEVEAIEIQREK
jgi:hypothetical protein